MIRFTLLDPFENCVMGSSTGMAAVELNDIFNCIVNGFGEAGDTSRLTLNCCVGFPVAGRLVEMAGNEPPPAGCTRSEKLRVEVVPAESATRITKSCVPAVVGVPDTIPAAESVKPAGRVPLKRLHAYGGVPPLACNC